MSKKPLMLCILDGFGSVSYTHLDVYKRQVQAKAKQLSGISIFNTGKSGYDRANIDKTAAVYAGCLLYTSRCV